MCSLWQIRTESSECGGMFLFLEENEQCGQVKQLGPDRSQLQQA
jgi:hypothetical protein